MHRVLLAFALVKLLPSMPLFNTQKSMSKTILRLKWLQLLLLGDTAETKEKGEEFFHT